ncbi:hypothetical protein Tco_0242704, partial [Tanacetum coccineum]
LQIHQSPIGIIINQAKYTLEILKKYGMDKCDSLGTPIATKPKLVADLRGTPVDQTRYQSMIGSLMYLTSSRLDIVQEYANVHVIKQDQQKNTSKSWMSKKQDCTAMSKVEAEYVMLSASCAQHSRTKNINVCYHFIKEQVEHGIIELYFFITEFKLADMFTKALSQDRFEYLVRRLGMRCLTPTELEVLAKETA